MVSCGECGRENPGGAKFCNSCGAPLLQPCPSCGTPNASDARFCSECGTPLGEKSPSAAPPPPKTETVTERRLVSVLFADLVGFTPLAETRDPEEVRELLSRYFDNCRRLIELYGGTVEKFIGDAVMAVWGTPTATEDDAERAVRAALDLVAAVTTLGRDADLPALAARAGVVTGEVAVDLAAVGQGMVAGDAVNTAARVQTSASPGQVLVDEGTFRRAEAAIAFEDAGLHQLKGKADSVRLRRALRVLAGVGGVQRLDGLEAPLIGRDVELRLLKDLFHATVARGSPRLVLVTGDAGSGKSRLGWEFEKYLDGIAQVVWWHRGRCLSYGDGVAYWAVAEMVRQRLGIAEEDPVETALPKLLDGVAERVPDPAERSYVGVRLGRLLGVPHPDDDGRELGRDELFAGWRTWLVRLAATAPVVWLIEDLQFADVALLDFLDHVLDWARSASIFLLAFSRPELEDRNPGWAVGRHRQQLVLEPLDRTAMVQLLDALVPGMPGDAVAAIADRAQGIPLFAIETIRALIDREVVVPREGVYRLVGELGELEVPDSLRALLAARLDHLDPEQRSLVADAAVLGDTFTAEALAAVAGRPIVEGRQILLELVRRELVTVSADPRSPQQGAFGFAHEVLRRVAYDTLSRHDRRTRHLAVADHLRAAMANDGEEVADVIARHLLDAVDAVPDHPDAAVVIERAVEELVRAGDRAGRLGAQARAAGDYAAAADRTADDATAAGYLLRASAANLLAARFEDAVEQADRARSHYEAAGDARGAARADAAAGNALGHAGRIDESRARTRRALEVLQDPPDVDTVLALRSLAANEVFAGGPDADRLSLEAVELAEQLEVPLPVQSAVLLTRGTMHAFTGHRMRAIAYYRESARLAELADDSIGAGKALNNLVVALLSTDPAGANEAARDVLARVSRSGDRYGVTVALINVVETSLQLGRWRDAGEELDRIAETGRDLDGFVFAHGELAALRGEHEVAQELAARLDALGSQNSELVAAVGLMRAYAADAAGQPTEALRHARRVLELRETLGLEQFAISWALPLAARAAHRIGARAEEQQVLDLLDSYRRTQ